MLELAFRGGRAYWGWVAALAAVLVAGLVAYGWQLYQGLTVTGLGRDVSWGLYIAQLTFLVGVAASAVMLVLPYYLHDYKTFGRITILGEFLAVTAVLTAMLFVAVDMGKPQRLLNVFLHPTPHSVMFWDVCVLSAYLALNLVLGWTGLAAQRKRLPPPAWLRPLAVLSIPLAVSIHTVTAFLYSGLAGRTYWFTAILAPRFLASAFAAGPAVLILICLLLRGVARFDAGREAIATLAKIVCYAIIMHLFFFGLEVFTVLYSQIPGHLAPLAYLYLGLDGKSALVPWMWSALVMGLVASVVLLVPRWRNDTRRLAGACALVLGCTWIDKGVGMMAGGFIPNPLHQVTEYAPTRVEIMVNLGIYALGALLFTVLCRMMVGVRGELGDLASSEARTRR